MPILFFDELDSSLKKMPHKWHFGSTHIYHKSMYCHFVAARPDYSLVFEDFANLFLLLLMLEDFIIKKEKEILFEVSKKLQRQMSVRSLTHIISYQLSCKKEERRENIDIELEEAF